MATQVTTIDIENEIYHMTVVIYKPDSPQKPSIQESHEGRVSPSIHAFKLEHVPHAIGEAIAHDNEVERPIYVYNVVKT